MNVVDLTASIPSKGTNGRRALSSIVHAVVHHDAVAAFGCYDPATRYVAEADYHLSHPETYGKRFAYHFKISALGAVYQVNPLEEITYHAGNYPYNVDGIGICLDGDFTKQALPAVQAQALRDLLAWLTTARPDLPKLVKATVKTHREVRLNPTTCPSDAVQAVVEAFRKA